MNLTKWEKFIFILKLAEVTCFDWERQRYYLIVVWFTPIIFLTKNAFIQYTDHLILVATPQTLGQCNSPV
jgi:hypothetical protein